jgi:DNA-binding XRE family transcriptional regulator
MPCSLLISVYAALKYIYIKNGLYQKPMLLTTRQSYMIKGHTLRQLRQQKGLTQKQAAQRMGISQQAFSRLEHSAWLQGEKLQALLTALQCTTADVEKAMSLLN